MPLPLLALGLAGMGLKNLNDNVNEAKAEGRQKRADQQALRDAVADVAPVERSVQPLGQTATMGPNMPTQEFKVGNQTTWNRDDADSTAAQMNTPEAKYARLGGALLNQAKPDEAMALEKNAAAMQDMRRKRSQALQAEGVSQFVDDNIAAAPDVAWVKANPGAVFNLAGVEQFNKTGGRITVPDGTKGRWKTLDMGDGREIVDFEMIGPDGKAFPNAQSARTLQWIQQMGTAGVEKEAAARHKAGQDAQFKRDELESLDNYRKGMVEASQTRADKTGAGGGRGGAEGIERLSPEAQQQYKFIIQELGDVTSSLSRAQGDPEYRGDGEGVRALMVRRAQLESKARLLLSGQLQPGGVPSGDPLGLFGDNAPPTFDVRGDPAAFRQKLAGKVDAQTLAAFDAQYPGATQKAGGQKPAQSNSAQPVARKSAVYGSAPSGRTQQAPGAKPTSPAAIAMQGLMLEEAEKKKNGKAAIYGSAPGRSSN